MKLTKIAVPFFASLMLLTGCQSAGVTLPGVSENNAAEAVAEKEIEDERPYYPTLDWDEKDYICTGGNYGGYLIEIGVDRLLSAGNTYDLLFSSSHATDKTIRVESSNANVAEVVRIDGDNENFKLVSKAYGDIILTIYNADEMMCYRNIVRVRYRADLENIDKAMFDVEKFATPDAYQTWFGSWVMSFVEYKDGAYGVFKGGDEYEQNVKITFNATFVEESDATDSYTFEVETVTTTASYTVLGWIMMARCLDCCYIYDSYGYLLTNLTAVQ